MVSLKLRENCVNLWAVEFLFSIRWKNSYSRELNRSIRLGEVNSGERYTNWNATSTTGHSNLKQAIGIRKYVKQQMQALQSDWFLIN